MRVAQELLGAPTIGRESAGPVSGGGGSQRSQISPPQATRNVQKLHQKGWFTALIDLTIAENAAN